MIVTVPERRAGPDEGDTVPAEAGSLALGSLAGDQR